MPKTFFQHDFNCHRKERFAALLKMGGAKAYGQFWLFQELFCMKQMHKEEWSETVRFNERELIAHLGCNARSFEKVMETFRKCFGIVSETFREPFGNVLQTTWPNALKYIEVRYKVNKKKRKQNKTFEEVFGKDE